MKLITLTLTLILALAHQANAQYRLGSPVEVAWDYTAANVTAGAVLRFEVKLDTGAWVNTGLPPTAATYEYQLPAVSLTIGSHTVYIRACGSLDCSAEPSPSATFTVIRPVPLPPTNIRIQPGNTIVSNERILELAKSYTLLVREEELRENELILLAQSYRGPIPPTYNSVMDHLDKVLLSLSGVK